MSKATITEPSVPKVRTPKARVPKVSKPKSAKTIAMMETKARNKERRKDMDIKVYEVKIDKSHVSKVKMQKIKDCFVQCKWIYNHVLSLENAFDCPEKIAELGVKVFNQETQKCDILEQRPLTIGSQIRAGMVKQVAQNIITLSKVKAKGGKVGKLKFKSEVNSVPLPQYGFTYSLKGNHHVNIQGIGKIRVNGLCQLKDSEISNANLVRKASGYFLKITCYKAKLVTERSGSIGLDFGIKDDITLSNGEKHNWDFPIPEELKNKQRRFAKKKKGSKRHAKQKQRIKKSYERLTRRKDDAANKFVSSLKRYEKVVIQDENIAGWSASLFGKQVQQSILGRIKSRIKNLETSVVIDRFLPTTKISPITGLCTDIKLKDRVFKDGSYEEDRDIKSAKTILCFGLESPHLTHKELMGLPVEEIKRIFRNYPFGDGSVICNISDETGSLIL